MQGLSINYSIAANCHNVMINSGNGTVTAFPAALPGAAILTATHGNLQVTATLTLTAAPPVPTYIYFDSPVYTLVIPQSGQSSIPVSATIYDQYNQPMHGLAIYYDMTATYSNVTINSVTGAITAFSSAQPVTATLTATHGNLNAEAQLTISAAPPRYIDLSLVQGNEYLIALTASDVASPPGKTFTITYDHTKLQLMNAAAQLNNTYTTMGAIPGTKLTVTQISPGSLTIHFSPETPSGKTWTGIATILKFKALTTGQTSVGIS